jgi:hypothetical protein
MSKHRWKGELKKPICIAVIPGFEETEQKVEEHYWNTIKEKRIEKLDLLMEHYAISDKTDFFHLALALAIDHVPGFRVDPPTALRLEHGDWGAVLHGNKKGGGHTWPPDRLDNLLDAVEEAKKKHGLSDDREALRVIMRNREKWGPPVNHRGTHEQWFETLESRLQDAKRNRREINALISLLNQNSGN